MLENVCPKNMFVEADRSKYYSWFWVASFDFKKAIASFSNWWNDKTYFVWFEMWQL